MVNVGDKSIMSRVVLESDITAFAEVSGDYNSVHLDEKKASRSFFGKRIAHGMFGGSLISSVISNQLPGDGTIYISQNLKFIKPIFIGDEVSTTVEVIEKIGRKIRLKTTCSVDGNEAISGEAVVSVVGDYHEN